MQNVFSVVESVKKKSPENLKEALEKTVEDFENLSPEVKSEIAGKFRHQQIFFEAQKSLA